MVRHPVAAAGFSAPGTDSHRFPRRAHFHLQHREIVTVTQDIAAAPEAVFDPPVGITNPPIDELLARASSKYALVIFAAKRARQINSYYNQIEEGILEYVGPLVDPGLHEKPLTIALRELHSDLLDCAEGE